MCSARDCSNTGVQSIASGKSKRIKEGVYSTEPSPKQAKYCLGCLAIKKDAKNRNRNIKRIKIKVQKKGLVLHKCCWVQKETIVFDGDTLGIPFLYNDQYIVCTVSANFSSPFIVPLGASISVPCAARRSCC